jgi:hypothetical protein
MAGALRTLYEGTQNCYNCNGTTVLVHTLKEHDPVARISFLIGFFGNIAWMAAKDLFTEGSACKNAAGLCLASRYPFTWSLFADRKE